MPTRTQHARGVFEVQMTPRPIEIDGLVARFRIEKTWRGDLSGTSTGEMLSAGDPGSGEAGYVALETFAGELAGRRGGFSLQQLGTMSRGRQSITYLVAPGSGTGGLGGISGVLDLNIDADGAHQYDLGYDLPS